MSRSKQLSRRTMLRGLGVSIGLPFLEAMLPRTARTAQEPVHPPRLAFLYVPGGVNLDAWTPDGEGTDYRPRFTLEALAPVRNDVLVLTGLNGRQQETGANGHPLGCAPWLSTAPVNDKDRGGYATDVTVDQLAARRIGQQTRLPSLELGCDRDAMQIYTSNISWRAPASPMGKEVSPRAVFTRLFGDAKADAYQRSILDLVGAEARRLRTQLGGVDRTKLDEYFDSIRAIERRIEVTERDAGRKPPEIAVPEGIPNEYPEHLGLLLELLVLGFQADSTRVATFMFNDEAGRSSWREIGIPEGHHDLAHLDPRTEEGQRRLEKLRRIDRWYVEQFVGMLQKLKSIREGEGTLLDNCMVVYGSGLAWGRLHNRENLPLLLGGGGRGTLTGGRHLHYSGEPVANLHLSLLERVGVPMERVADSTGPLAQLTA